MCLMLPQFFWGHLSRFCDISCWFPRLHKQIVIDTLNIKKWAIKNGKNNDIFFFDEQTILIDLVSRNAKLT